MNAQHTPGPWRVGKDGNVHETFLLAELRGIYREKNANARLIAAAPALLAALREIGDIVDCNSKTTIAAKRIALAAIAQFYNMESQS